LTLKNNIDAPFLAAVVRRARHLAALRTHFGVRSQQSPNGRERYQAANRKAGEPTLEIQYKPLFVVGYLRGAEIALKPQQICRASQLCDTFTVKKQNWAFAGNPEA
jgi:hypothetical protein